MSFKAKDIMTSPFVSVNAKSTVDEALELLLRHHVSGLPVVDDNDALLGVISEYDLLKLLYEPSSDPPCIESFVTTDVLSTDVDDSLPEIADLFLTKSIRRLPVICDGKVVGIISRRDLIRYIHLCRVRLAQDLEDRRVAVSV